MLDAKRNTAETICTWYLEADVASPDVGRKIPVIIIVTAAYSCKYSTKKEQACIHEEGLACMVLVKTRKVGQTLHGSVPEHIEAATKSTYYGTKVAKIGLSCLTKEGAARAFLVEVHTHFLCIPHTTLYTASHLATGKEGCKTSAVLYTAVDVVQLVAKKFPCCLNRDARILHAHILLYELLLLLDVPHYGVARLSAIHYEQVEGSLYLNIHVELSCIVLLYQAIQDFRIDLQEVLVELDGVVRCLSYPHGAVGIKSITKEVTQHKLGVTGCVEG